MKLLLVLRELCSRRHTGPHDDLCVGARSLTRRLVCMLSWHRQRFAHTALGRYSLFTHGVGERRLGHASKGFEKGQALRREDIDLAADHDGEADHARRNEPRRTAQA